MVSVDGFFAGVDGNLDWHNVDDEFNKFVVEQLREFHTILFGRTTYQMFESFWPVALKDQKTSEDNRKVAQSINDIEKIVFSSTLEKVTWNNSKILKKIDSEEIKKLKQEPGKDMVIFGSGTIVQAMTNLNLIDEYRLMINPVLLGQGKPMFKDMKDKVNLKLRNTKTFKNGNVLICYKIK